MGYQNKKIKIGLSLFGCEENLKLELLIIRSELSTITILITLFFIKIQLRSKLNPEKDFADAFKVFDRDGKLVPSSSRDQQESLKP